MDWSAIALSLRLATATTMILLVVGLPLASWLALSERRGRWAVDATYSPRAAARIPVCGLGTGGGPDAAARHHAKPLPARDLLRRELEACGVIVSCGMVFKCLGNHESHGANSDFMGFRSMSVALIHANINRQCLSATVECTTSTAGAM